MAGVVVALVGAFVLFALARLWFLHSGRQQSLVFRYASMLFRRELNPELTIRLDRIFGTTFLSACGIFCLILAIAEALKI
jgi:hypothetical protein